MTAHSSRDGSHGAMISSVNFKVFADKVGSDGRKHADPNSFFHIRLNAEDYEGVRDVAQRLVTMTDGAIYRVANVAYKAA